MIIKYPIADRAISQEFGRNAAQDLVYRKFYELFDYKHCGVDFSVPVGTRVYASFPGIVVRNENHVGMGNVIGIRNGNIVALYAHLDRSLATLGDIVDEGTLIGVSGCTGETCLTPHFHFELRDITKGSLKEMVFDPPFGQEPDCFRNIFVYFVNNKNTKKTLKSLSKLYFGTDERWPLIKSVNTLDTDGASLLEDDLKLIIPNYK